MKGKERKGKERKGKERKGKMLVNLSKKKQYTVQKRNETIAYHVTVYSPDSRIVGNKSDGNPSRKKLYSSLFSLFHFTNGTIWHPIYVIGERKCEIFFTLR